MYANIELPLLFAAFSICEVKDIVMKMPEPPWRHATRWRLAVADGSNTMRPRPQKKRTWNAIWHSRHIWPQIDNYERPVYKWLQCPAHRKTNKRMWHENRIFMRGCAHSNKRRLLLRCTGFSSPDIPQSRELAWSDLAWAWPGTWLMFWDHQMSTHHTGGHRRIKSFDRPTSPFLLVHLRSV